MKIALLTDFGSTFTKVTAVRLDSAQIIGRGQSQTTSGSDILDGYEIAVRAALSEVAGPTEVVQEVGASSAGGGLQMVAVGLVPDLTAKAAETAALNAGARVKAVMAGSLGQEDVEQLEKLQPEIVLFAGGTDGGQVQRVLDNADVVGSANIQTQVVVACNKLIACDVKKRIEASGNQVTVVANVMPEIGEVNVEPARLAIKSLFLSHVIRGKQLSASRRFEELVVMATPDAVLHGTALLASCLEGTEVGDAVIVSDVGGATTDLYSAVVRRPFISRRTSHQLSRLPPVVRTVEGDLGIRFNAEAVLEADRSWLEQQLGDADRLRSACLYRGQNPSVVFEGGWEREVDEHLALSCMTSGLRRHCGIHKVRVGVAGRPRHVVTEPDLRCAGTFVAGGGIIRESPSAEDLVAQAVYRQAESTLSPRSCQVRIDRRHVLVTVGLLVGQNMGAASALLKTELGWN